MKKVINLIFCIIIIVANIVIFTPSKVHAICNTIKFSKEVSAVRLTLSDGSILYDLALEKDTTPQANLTSANYKNLNLIFVVETKNGLDQNKSAMSQFIKNVYQSYTNGNDRIRMGVIQFNDLSQTQIDERKENINTEQDIWKDSQESILNEVSNLKTDSNQTIQEALMIAQYNMQSNNGSKNDSLIQQIIIITDGINNEDVCASSNAILRDLSENMVSMYGVFIGVSQNNNNIKELTNKVYELRASYDVSLENVVYQLTTDVYEYIRQYMIRESTIIPKVNKTSMITNNSITLFVDEELIYGATLKIEYIITLSRVAIYGDGSIYENKILDEKDPKLIFRKNETLITDASKTNADYGWNETPEGLITNKNAKEIKLVLSTIITPEQMNNAVYSNTAKCTTAYDVGGGATARYTLSDESIDVIVMPPFGKTELNVEKIITITIGIVATILCLIITFFIIVRHKRK